MSDLELADDGDLAVGLTMIDGSAAVRQAIQIRLSLFRGEWFLDRRVGVPYYQQVLTKQPKGLATVDSIFKDAILNTPDVNSLTSYSSVLDDQRHLAVAFTVDTDFGLLEDTWQDSL